MLNVEEQIRRLADVSFDATDPVTFAPPAEQARSRRTRSVAIAAAVICVAGLGGLIAIAQTRSTNPANVARYTVTDPLAIDLDGAIGISEQLRIAAIGPLLTYDFAQLPDGWVTRTLHATTSIGSLDRPEFWQQVEVTSPGRVAMVVNIEGPVDEGAPLALPSNPDTRGEPVDVRGQAARQTFSTLSWVEQDRARVMIVAKLDGLDIRTETLELAQLLQPIRAELDWQEEPPSGPPLADAPTVLAGTLADTPWRLVLAPDGLALATGSDAVSRSNGVPPQDNATEIGYSIESVGTGGGVVVYGDAPNVAHRVRLRTNNSITELPTASTSDGRVVFAVPIDDRLDPVGIDVLDDGGRVLATIGLEDLPPFFGGVLRSAVGLSP
jgi:hypothetical protein